MPLDAPRPTRLRPRPAGRSSLWLRPFTYTLRLLTLGLGLGVLGGTLLSFWLGSDAKKVGGLTVAASNQPLTWESFFWPSAVSGETGETALMPLMERPAGLDEVVALKTEMTPLKQQLLPLLTRNKSINGYLFVADLDTGEYLNLGGDQPVPAASTIKVPILIAFFQEVDQGRVRLDEKLVMRKDLIAGGSGEMQFQAPGTVYTALETATLMNVISDNTATNMLIERLGGFEALNQRFREWGLEHTVIRNVLPDLKGTNTVSPQDMVHLMALVEKGELLSRRSRDWVLQIMSDTRTRTLLPQGLGAGARIAHKTGDIGFIIGDVGLIDAANGQRYLMTMFVRRPYDDPQGSELLRQVSRLTYAYLTQPRPAAAPPSAPTTP
ncbi:MAG: serine hydrolase [Gloeomargaritaceae cyanobacterium C42_A2020_066]|nr:serine hydrolase [Gloeomargaritaceae cyanobacterium C42_A2020_066]